MQTEMFFNDIFRATWQAEMGIGHSAPMHAATYLWNGMTCEAVMRMSPPVLFGRPAGAAQGGAWARLMTLKARLR